MAINEDEARSKSSRRSFLKVGAGVVAAGAVVAAATVSQIPAVSAAGGSPAQASATSPSSSELSSTGSLGSESSQTQSSSAQSLDVSRQAFVYLNVAQQTLLEAVVETIIPSDSNGPGAKEAGVVYFIDGQLGSGYGYSGNMYTKGPYVPQGVTSPLTVDGITYSGGTIPRSTTSGTYFQYHMNLNQFWTFGLDALQTYANSAYGGNYEALSAADQTKVLQDLWNNVPSTPSFYGIAPVDFAHELFMMAWAGFLMDPVYGGNQGMVGWKLLGFNGLNSGNFYGEGYTYKSLIGATTLIPLQPASIGQAQSGTP